MLFNQLNIGDKVYIIEVVGTFKKTTEYNEGSVTQVSSIYDEPLPPGQFPMPNQPRKKVVDITIQCNGETKKFTIPENKSVITDNSIGLTISTDKQEIINIVRNQYNTYKQRKEAIAKCDEEMAKCQVLLDKLGVDNEPARENDKILEAMKCDVDEGSYKHNEIPMVAIWNKISEMPMHIDDEYRLADPFNIYTKNSVETLNKIIEWFDTNTLKWTLEKRDSYSKKASKMCLLTDQQLKQRNLI